MSNFSENFRYLYRSHDFVNQAALGKELGIERSVLSKLMTGTRVPTPSQKSQIARYFKLRPSELDLKHDVFLSVVEDVIANSNLIFLSFRTTKQSFERCEQIVTRYKGHYLVYYPKANDNDTVVASVLEIARATREGIEVSLVNPHRDSSGNKAPYEYVGYMYPVREFFYFFLEQKNADYEILCMIVRESRTPQVAVLKGLFAGVGVLDDASMIAARPVVLLRRKRQLDWRTALGGEIGYIPRGRVPEIARRQLSEEKITVRE